MALYEVGITRCEMLSVRYYLTVEAESAEAAKMKVFEGDLTDAEEATLEEGKCFGIQDSWLATVDFANPLAERN